MSHRYRVTAKIGRVYLTIDVWARSAICARRLAPHEMTESLGRLVLPQHVTGVRRLWLGGWV
jgi:hypothetical protein